MDTQTSSLGPKRSTVNLVRSSHSWTEADSAAGFVLRYLAPMRRQLVAVLGSETEADQALRILLNHLVSAGFGEHRNGRLRDFLLRAVRSCAKARLNELGRQSGEPGKPSGINLSSKEWIIRWRECLLQRAWRALERTEHQDPQRPLYSVLLARSTHPKADLTELCAAVKKRSGVELTPAELDAMKMEAKAAFAQLLADEVVETLEHPDKASVQTEIKSLGIGSAFAGLGV
ncbi:hypothetical protein FYK55_08945 [Roseiconus nitratireducens]|uniref:Uncharacterized protein n=1 Tax=Roseiconus nitratireducens TaxID=2605748 RepID=A0A5M6DA58_9BACT|nr:hypothetical protein [Roseiconus nitratireducens]KAA5544448.1 hypothetical protein FYK55_08945 [Roseiconus nitratireducens]